MAMYDPTQVGPGPMGDPDPEKTQLVCGHWIDGAAVGAPGTQAKCRATEFEIHLVPTGAISVCPACRAQDDLRIYRTTNVTTAAEAGTAGAMAPTTRVCGTCRGIRFRLYDDGNALETRCATCGRIEPLGVSRSIGV